MSSPKLAAELLAHEQWEPAFEALLSAWQSHRAPALEGVIASLSDYLAGGLAPIDPDADDDWNEQWRRRARSKRAVELGVLLGHVKRAPKGEIPRRLRALLEFGPDPRIGALLVEMIEQPPITASSNFSMWTELFAALPAHVDARAAPRLQARAADRGGKSQFWTKLEAWIKAALPKLAEPVGLPAQWEAELEELERGIADALKLPAPELRVADEPVIAVRPEVDDLAPICASLDAGELAHALDRLVGYWGQRRSPRIAALIDRLGLLVDEHQAPPSGRTKAAMHTAWMEAAAAPQPSAVGPLLASLREGQLRDVEARIEAMIHWRPDPRVAQAMVGLTKDHMLGARDRLWRAVHDALVHHADPRVADEVRARHERLANAHVLHRHISEGRELRRVFEAFTAAVAADHELTSDQCEHAEQIERTLAERVTNERAGDALERALVEAIAANWDDDGPRLVYSDWLQSRHDPRGEFIALDLALAQGKKVKGARDKHFKAHKAALLGPLAGVMTWGEKFERGLLTVARCSTKSGGLDIGEDRRRELLEDLRWATVRELDVPHDDLEIAALFERAPLLALDRLSGPGLAALAGFARREDTLPLRCLSVNASEGDTDEAWAHVGGLTRVLPRVEVIAIMIWARAGGRLTPPLSCFQGELIRRASELINGGKQTGGVARIDEWISRMAACECPVPMLRVIGPELSAELRQVELGRFELDLTLDRLRWPDRDATLAVLAALRGLPRPRIASLKLTCGVIEDSIRADVDAALDGLPVELA